MSHNMDHNHYRFEGSSIERVNQKPFTSLNQNPCDQYDHQKPVANAVGKNGACTTSSNSYMVIRLRRDVLPLLSDAEERMEFFSRSRLVRKALERVHQGKLRLPTGRRAGILKRIFTDWAASNETCVVVRMALSGYRSARLLARRRPGRLRLPQQPQGRRLSLSLGATRPVVVPIKGRDVKAVRDGDGEISRHAECEREAVILTRYPLVSPP
jgi:hypothetical protein